MKTTVEIPDPLFRQAKALAAQRGLSLKEFFTAAIRQQLQSAGAGSSNTVDPPWKKAFGGLRDLHTETKRIERIIAKEFGS